MTTRNTNGQQGSSGDRNRRAGHRGNGEGSIGPWKNGLWRARLMVGLKADGRPDVREVYGRARAEARRKLTELRRRADQGLLADATTERETVGAFLTRWLDATKTTLRPRTWRRYAELVRLHVIPGLGRAKLSGLRPDALQRLYAQKLDEGLAPRTVHHVHMVVHRALAQAVRWGYAPRNVADAVDPPAVPGKEVRPPTPGEIRRLLDAAVASGDPRRPSGRSPCTPGAGRASSWDSAGRKSTWPGVP
jgi:hypothetical protein